MRFSCTAVLRLTSTPFFLIVRNQDLEKGNLEPSQQCRVADTQFPSPTQWPGQRHFKPGNAEAFHLERDRSLLRKALAAPVSFPNKEGATGADTQIQENQC